MPKEKLNDLVKAAYQTAKDLVSDVKNEPIMPVFILLDRNRKVHIIGTPFESDKEKDMAAAFVRQTAKEIGAVAYIHVCEAWVTVIPQDTPRDEIVKPSKSDLRREVLVVAGEDEDGNIISRMWSIERDQDNKRTIGPEDKGFRDVENLEGRFANLLSQ